MVLLGITSEVETITFSHTIERSLTERILGRSQDAHSAFLNFPISPIAQLLAAMCRMTCIDNLRHSFEESFFFLGCWLLAFCWLHTIRAPFDCSYADGNI